MAKNGQLPPMLRHYLEIKAQHPDAFLFYRMGDFYELFFDDAEKAAPILEVVLTSRHKGTDNEVPMCGVPHHAVDGYVGRILRAGMKVAICDQVEDPAQARGLVRREVTAVLTPGTITQPDLLEGKEDNLLAALIWDGTAGAGAFLDVSTGQFFVRRWRDGEHCLEDLGVLRPREVLSEPDQLPAPVRRWIDAEVLCQTVLEDDLLPDPFRAGEMLMRQLRVETLRGFGLAADEPAVRAAAAALQYVQLTQQSDLSHVRDLVVGDGSTEMVVDSTTLANLEVFRNQREGTRRTTLLSVVDRTVTPAGGRRLRKWLGRPLKDPKAIGERHEAVAELVARGVVRDQVRGHLARLGDPERLLGRAVLGTLTPREAAALRDGLRLVPGVLAALGSCEAPLLVGVAATDPIADLAAELGRVLTENPPATLHNGDVIAAGVDPELDRCRSLARDSKQHILSLEAGEREKTRIGSLKIRYNKVFGYYLEVPNTSQHLVPSHYIRKQTLVHAERYITPEVKELEEQILEAEGKQLALEEEHFAALRQRVVADGDGIRALSDALATLDVVAAFAEQAAHHRYCRPQVTAPGGPITIRDGRHPVVETMGKDAFIPNDADLDGEKAQIVLLTGPNMGGKSTYLRQVALIVLMAQAGSFVPAKSAEIGAVDRIFTRVGASDDLARGESTFMVEMIETANILHHATAESLVILDEVGRGTATFDGLSLAWAIVEYLHQHRQPKTLFATHYHELTDLSSVLARVVNRTMQVKEWKEKIVFLHRVIEGSADKSYGIHVARLAGLPPAVLERAAEVLSQLEEKEYDLTGRPRLARDEEPPPKRDNGQLSLFTPPAEVVASILRDLEVDAMTPLAALNLLHSLKSRLGGAS